MPLAGAEDLRDEAGEARGRRGALSLRHAVEKEQLRPKGAAAATAPPRPLVAAAALGGLLWLALPVTLPLRRRKRGATETLDVAVVLVAVRSVDDATTRRAVLQR